MSLEISKAIVMNVPQRVLLRPSARRTILSLLFAFLVTWPLSAATVTLLPPENPAGERVRAQLQRIDATPVQRRELTLRIGEPADLGVADGTWELQVTSDVYWSAPVMVTAHTDARRQLWRRATLAGTFGSRVAPPGELRVEFTSSAADPGVEPVQGSALCRTADKSWTCSVPATRLDLQFGVKGFATEFRWNVDAVTGTTTNLGRFDFTPGASLAGHLEQKGHGKPAMDRMDVSLSVANPGPADKVRRLTVRPNARGFFQFKGVPAGRYVVRAEGAGLVTAPRAIDVIAGLNAVLREPLIAAKPRQLSIDLMPMTDSSGQRWLVELYAKSPTSPVIDLVTQDVASVTGRWVAARVTPGDYALYVRRTNGSVWKIEEFIMPADDLALPVLVEGQRVKGTVTLGDRAIPATVQFEGAETFIADERGHFEGTVRKLPENTQILVTHDGPAISRHVELAGVVAADGARVFDIELPNTTIMGRTINEDGSPVPFAILNIRGKGAKLVEQPGSDEDGRFQIAGLEPGTYKMQAEGFNKSSAVVDVEASDAPSPTEIDLVLRDQEEVRGEVMMGSLRIPSAEIHALPRYVATSFVPAAKSDPNGQFALYLPPGTETYDALVVAPGFAAVMGRIVRTPKKILHVETTQTGGSLSITLPAGAPATLRREGGEFQLSWIVWKTGGTVERQGEQDRVTVPNLEPGQYELCIQKRCASAFVPPLAVATVSLRE